MVIQTHLKMLRNLVFPIWFLNMAIIIITRYHKIPITIPWKECSVRMFIWVKKTSGTKSFCVTKARLLALYRKWLRISDKRNWLLCLLLPQDVSAVCAWVSHHVWYCGASPPPCYPDLCIMKFCFFQWMNGSLSGCRFQAVTECQQLRKTVEGFAYDCFQKCL
jgi:hypothetical protein